MGINNLQPAAKGILCGAALLCIAFSLASCAADKAVEAFAPPSVQAVVTHRAVIGPAAAPSRQPREKAALEDCFVARAEVHYLEVLPDSLFSALSTAAELILSYPGGELVRPAPVLFQGARWGEPYAPDAFASELANGDYGRSAPIESLATVLPPAAAAIFRIEDTFPSSHEAGGTLFRRSMEIRLVRGAGGGEDGPRRPDAMVSCVLALEDFAPPQRAGEDIPVVERGESPPAAYAIPTSEQVVMPAQPCTFGRTWAVICLSPFAGPPRRALAAVISVEPVGRASETAVDLAQELDRAQSDIAGARELLFVADADFDSDVGLVADPAFEIDLDHAGSVKQGREEDAAAAADGEAVATALEHVAAFEQRRSALLYILTMLKTRVAVDLTLVASEELLVDLAEAIRRARSEKAFDSGSLAWTVERAAYRVLVSAAWSGDPEPDLFGLLTLYTGVLSRDPWTLDEIVNTCTSIDECRRRIVGENLLALEGSSLAARAQAFEFLHARGLAPAGYDPMGPRQERRNALFRTLESIEPAGGSGAEEGEKP